MGGGLTVIQPGKIDVSSIFATPLVGKQAHKAMAGFREHVTARARPVTAVVHGGSGTGKSRLLYEFRNEMLADGSHVHSFSGEDGDPTTFDEWIRPLVSKLYQLPLAPINDPLPPLRASPRVPRDHRVHSVLYDASAPSAQMPAAWRW